MAKLLIVDDEQKIREKADRYIYDFEELLNCEREKNA